MKPSGPSASPRTHARGILVASLTTCLLALLVSPLPVRAWTPELGQPLLPNDAWWLWPKAAEKDAAKGIPEGGLTVNTGSRAGVKAFYESVYVPAFSVPVGWTGSIAGCVAGTTSTAYRNATLDVINFFRAMSGLPGDVTLDTTFNAKDQAAALMMIAEGELSHFPDPSFACFTADGAEAAGASNLALGLAGPDAILAYLNDFGVGNEATGHRRWVLYPPQMDMGSGSTDGVNGLDVGSQALWVVANAFGARPSSPDWVAFPSPGYVPYQLVFPPAFTGFGANRWTLSRNLAMADFPPIDASVDFSAATVTMTQDGSPVPLTVVSRTDQFGDATLVWEPSGMSFTPGSPDVVIDVLVEDVEVDGVMTDHSYSVILFDTTVEDLGLVFEDGFESGNTSAWDATVSP